MGKDLEGHDGGIFWGNVSVFECGQWGKSREYLVILTGLWDCKRLAELTESWCFSTKCVSWLRPQFVAFIWQDTNVACDLGQTPYLLLCFLHNFHRYFPFSCLSLALFWEFLLTHHLLRNAAGSFLVSTRLSPLTVRPTVPQRPIREGFHKWKVQ